MRVRKEFYEVEENFRKKNFLGIFFGFSKKKEIQMFFEGNTQNSFLNLKKICFLPRDLKTNLEKKFFYQRKWKFSSKRK